MVEYCSTECSKQFFECLDVERVTMGCNVACPFLPCKHREDWGLDDPTGKSDAEFERSIKVICSKVEDLRERILNTHLR